MINHFVHSKHNSLNPEIMFCEFRSTPVYMQSLSENSVFIFFHLSSPLNL
jgi:hypothetical protein